MLWLQATLKRYQTEHRSKLDSLEKSQAELKKIRRKSQGARNVMKYEHKEMEVSALSLKLFVSFVVWELVNRKRWAITGHIWVCSKTWLRKLTAIFVYAVLLINTHNSSVSCLAMVKSSKGFDSSKLVYIKVCIPVEIKLWTALLYILWDLCFSF